MTSKEPYSKGLFPSSRLNNPAQFTSTHLKLFGLIHTIPGTNFLMEEPFKRDDPVGADEYTNEKTRAGKAKSFHTDNVDYELGLVVEAVGKGSSSNDPKRDAFFKAKGLEIIKFTNEEIKRCPHLVRQNVELKVENIRLKLALRNIFTTGRVA